MQARACVYVRVCELLLTVSRELELRYAVRSVGGTYAVWYFGGGGPGTYVGRQLTGQAVHLFAGVAQFALEAAHLVRLPLLGRSVQRRAAR